MSLPRNKRRSSRRGVAALAIAVGLVAAACGSNGPSLTPAPAVTPAPTAAPSVAPSPSAAASGAGASAGPNVGAVYDTIEQQVQDIRGLRAKKPVPRQVITTDELKQRLTEQFDKAAPPAYVAAPHR